MHTIQLAVNAVLESIHANDALSAARPVTEHLKKVLLVQQQCSNTCQAVTDVCIKPPDDHS